MLDVSLVLAANRRGDAQRDRQHAFDSVVGCRRAGTLVRALDPLDVLVPERLALAAELDRGYGGEVMSSSRSPKLTTTLSQSHRRWSIGAARPSNFRCFLGLSSRYSSRCS